MSNESECASLSPSKGLRSLLRCRFWVCGISAATAITLSRCGGHFYLISLRFGEFKMHPYHILKGSWLGLPNVFNVSGIQDAPLSHFGGVRVNCT